MNQTPEQPRPEPTQQFSHHAYYQLIHTLRQILPPPLANTPEAMLTRDHAAIAKIAAMAPVNDDEADVAAHCVVARGQAEDVMRQIRASVGDLQRVNQLNAQFALMERTGISLRNQLLRMQAARFKREATNAAADTDEWAKHIAMRQMQQVLDQVTATSVPAAQPLVPASAGEPLPASVPVPAPFAPLRPAELPAAVASQTPAAQPPQSSVQAARSTAPPSVVAPPPAPASAAASHGHCVPTVAETDAPLCSQAAGTDGPSRKPAADSDKSPDKPTTESNAPPRNLAAEAEHYAGIYPRRAEAIRRYGGLPPNCNFGPPDADLVSAIVAGTCPTLCALDAPAAATA